MGTTKYPRGKLQFHHDILKHYLQVMMDYRVAMHVSLDYFKSFGFEPTDELMELVRRNEPQKPNGTWKAGWGPGGAPRCPCCGSRLKIGRDIHCHKCGQKIDWTTEVGQV